MNRRRQAARPRTWITVSGALVAIAALLVVLPASAAELRKVRVGAHDGFTRVVFELDHSTGYRVEKAGTAAAPELRVTVEAASGAHDVGSHGDVRGVKVAPGPTAVARIPLTRTGLRLREMILSNPPRIVLDLKRPEPVATTKPATTPVAVKPEPKPAPTPVAVKPEPKPAPKPVAVKPEPKPAPKPVAVKPEPKPAPKPVAVKPEPKPAPKPVAVKPEPKPAPTPVAVKPEPMPVAVKPEPKPAPTPVAVKPEPKPDPGSATPIARPAQIAKPAKQPRPLARPAKPANMPVLKPQPSIEPEPEAGSETSWFARMTGNPLMLGGMAGGLVALVGIVVTLRRRGRSLPSDLDADAISQELDSDDGAAASVHKPVSVSAPVAAAATASADADAGFDDLFDAGSAPASSSRTPIDLPSDPEPDSEPASIAGPEFDVEAPVEHSAAPDSIFEDASQGETPMNQDMDLPADRSSLAPSPPPPVMDAAPELGAVSGAGSSDVAQMLEAFERRIQGLESKLEAANESREKLERQVAAQSEELRVQRAAIARTQRALRTMSRGDEDKATEPALREGDTTQAKTRVNV